MQAVELTPMRRAIGRRMTASKREAPHFYVTAQIELDAALRRLERENAEAPDAERVTLTALVVCACARALEEHPRLNAVWDGEDLLRSEVVNVAVAVALDDGLVAPALLGCEERGLRATAAALRDLVGRARGGRLRGEEMVRGTFTVSNLGMFGIQSFIPIVTPPQVAILGVGGVDRVPRLAEGQLVERSLLSVTVSADHRAVDGADVARFLVTLKATIEQPEAIDG
jgi:pyruvate dehydrogenase E2 component (dihydrolipoyllysine-residue acetyltransferase)